MTHLLEQTIKRLRGLASLPEAQQQQVAEQVWAVLDEIESHKEHEPFQVKKRIAGLGKGTFIVPDDFDDPLPDSFWLGEE